MCIISLLTVNVHWFLLIFNPKTPFLWSTWDPIFTEKIWPRIPSIGLGTVKSVEFKLWMIQNCIKAKLKIKVGPKKVAVFTI